MRIYLPLEDVADIVLDETNGVVSLHCTIHKFNRSTYIPIRDAIEHALEVANSNVVYTGAKNPDEKMLKCWAKVGFNVYTVLDGVTIAKWEK